MTQEMPDSLITMGACSREEPQPKLKPPTITSPALTTSTKCLSMSSMQWVASSFLSAMFR